MYRQISVEAHLWNELKFLYDLYLVSTLQVGSLTCSINSVMLHYFCCHGNIKFQYICLFDREEGSLDIQILAASALTVLSIVHNDILSWITAFLDLWNSQFLFCRECVSKLHRELAMLPISDVLWPYLEMRVLIFMDTILNLQQMFQLNQFYSLLCSAGPYSNRDLLEFHILAC